MAHFPLLLQGRLGAAKALASRISLCEFLKRDFYRLDAKPTVSKDPKHIYLVPATAQPIKQHTVADSRPAIVSGRLRLLLCLAISNFETLFVNMFVSNRPAAIGRLQLSSRNTWAI